MVNNNEMGVLIDRLQDVDLYRDAYEEAQRIIRISDEVRITLERVERKADIPATLEPKLDAPRATIEAPPSAALTGTKQYEKITTAKIAAKLGMTTKAFQERLVELGMLELRDGGRHYLGDAGKDAGGKWRPGPGRG
jgi:hypothetical protein